MNNWPASSVYLLCQFEHHLADRGSFIGWGVMCILVRVWVKPVLVVNLGACICLALVTLIIAHKGDVIAQRGHSAGNLNFCDVPQAITTEDQKFLDAVFQQQNQDDQRQTSPVAKSGQTGAKAESDSKPVPKAELIVNTSEVKRAQLVVNSRVVERAEQVRHRGQ